MPRATAMPPEERRRAIVDAVVPILERDQTVPSTKEIAAAAGIAEGTIFRVFPDMRALWREVAAQTLDADGELAAIRAAVAPHTELRPRLHALVEHLLDRSRRITTVMGVMRSAWSNCSPEEHRRRVAEGPPAFLTASREAVMRGIAEALEPHRDQLAVAPDVAARVLRALVTGARHPGLTDDDVEPLDADLLTDVVLHGVARPTD